MSKSFVSRVLDICLDHAVPDGPESIGKTHQVVEFHQPKDLEEILQKELQLNDPGLSEQEFEDLCRTMARYSCKTWHPRFMTQLFSGIDPVSLSASFLQESLNTSAYTFEAAPVITVIQRRIIQEMLQFYGLPTETGDGVFTPGASLGNMYAMLLARQNRFPLSKQMGFKGLPDLVIFTSDISHYSIEKGAILLGFGLNSIFKVESDDDGVMKPEKLREAINLTIKSGKVPLMVYATAGTTMPGTFDNIEAIADVCGEFKEKIWLHCDGAYGGSAIFSAKLKHLLKGSERCDSITVDFHKIAGALMQCSLTVSKHGNLFREAISCCASYLFQGDKGYDTSYDSGDISIQCSQKGDALKWWLFWKAKGRWGVEKEMDYLSSLAQFAHNRISEMGDQGFFLAMPKLAYVNVCFWYVPAWMRAEAGDKWKDHPLLPKLTTKVRAKLRESGELLINAANHKKLPTYFRMVCLNRLLTKELILEYLELIKNTAESIDKNDL